MTEMELSERVLKEETQYTYRMARRSWSYDAMQEERVMRGAIDVHQHGGPDVQTRVWDEVQLTVDAARAGLAAVVFKNHVTMTSGRSEVVRQAAASRLKIEEDGSALPLVIGGVVLNAAVGGFNSEAVVASIGLGGRFVWLPSFDSAHHHHMTSDPEKGIEPTRNGKVVPELREILGIIAEHDQVLSLCHLSVAERFKVIEEARAVGVDRILVDHPLLAVTRTSLADQRRMADMGAMIGLYVQCCIPNIMNLSVDFERDTLGMLDQVGPNALVVGTDLGQPQNMHPIEGMRMLYRSLAQYDISEDDLVTVFQRNGRRLIGIEP